MSTITYTEWLLLSLVEKYNMYTHPNTSEIYKNHEVNGVRLEKYKKVNTEHKHRVSLWMGQDFHKIRDACLAKNMLFQDPYFVSTNSTVLQYDDSTYEWKRPYEISVNPQFIIEGESRFDVEQGDIGDCWLNVSMANLTLNKKLFSRVVPNDQSFSDKYAGVFYFRVWKYGTWHEVVIDDRLPTYKGVLIFSSSKNVNEFWSALLEKAYAKCHGSYKALEEGWMNEAMQDFTGGITESYSLSNAAPNLFEIMLKAYKNSSFMGAATSENGSIDKGILQQHLYSITKIHKGDKKLPLVRLRNPWGRDEWKGDWGDGCEKWNILSSEERNQLDLNFDNDGEFWMHFQDFQKIFDNLEICHLTVESLWGDDLLSNNKKIWKMSAHDGQWIRCKSAGGYISNSDTFWQNPQFCIKLTEVHDDVKKTCRLSVSLLQKNRRCPNLLSIGFVIFQLPNQSDRPKILDKEFLTDKNVIANSGEYASSREVTRKFNLHPGTYYIIPTTYSPDVEGEFLLRIFTERKFITI